MDTNTSEIDKNNLSTYIKYSETPIIKEINPVFTIYWRGRKDKNYKEYYHTPDIIDGGHIVTAYVKNKICHISLSRDGYAWSTLLEEKTFKIDKCKEYKVYIEDGHIIVPHVELTTVFDHTIVKAEVPIGFTLRHKLRLIKLTNPISIIRDKIFTEYAMDTDSSNISFKKPEHSKH